jgi:hypothetical protein
MLAMLASSLGAHWSAGLFIGGVAFQGRWSNKS